MKTTAAVLCFLAACGWHVALAGEVRRIALDGRPAAVASAIAPGKDGIGRIAKIADAQLMLYPAAKKPSRGTVMILPGGGYGFLAIGHEGTAVAQLLNDDGFDAATLLYHINAGPPTRALALADARTALALIRKRGMEFGLDARKVGVLGFSAGGHLTARLAHETAAAGQPPDFLVLMYPAYLEKNGRLLDDVAPIRAPTFLYVATNDPYAPSASAYAAACREKNIPCEFHQAERGGHGFGLKQPLPDGVQDWPAQLKTWLDGLP
ncbi:MAG: alpha/beta hydrolase [Kiritimatiellaeota bacterium]|nr:alpha/beta hydrolase [Kiritimatiellota bacterium]